VKRYVLGFLFNRNLTKVVLIKKTHGPNNQVGRYNGVGGEAMDTEMYMHAMEREFYEETDVVVDALSWTRFATVNGKGYQIVCFYSVVETDDELNGVQPKTDEVPEVWSVYPIVLAGSLPLVAGVTWLIEMARAHARGEDTSVYEVCR
jgi:ADP-ribose pyrophosphatase YjhB (NUDIX family)